MISVRRYGLAVVVLSIVSVVSVRSVVGAPIESVQIVAVRQPVVAVQAVVESIISAVVQPILESLVVQAVEPVLALVEILLDATWIHGVEPAQLTHRIQTGLRLLARDGNQAKGGQKNILLAVHRDALGSSIGSDLLCCRFVVSIQECRAR